MANGKKKDVKKLKVKSAPDLRGGAIGAKGACELGNGATKGSDLVGAKAACELGNLGLGSK